MVSDAGGAVARRRRDVSKQLSLSCRFFTFLNPFESFGYLPDHHCSSSSIMYMVVGDPFNSFSRSSSLRRSFNPTRSFFTFRRATWSPVRSISETMTSTRTSASSHLRVKRSMKLSSNLHAPSTNLLRRTVCDTKTKNPAPPLSRFVPSSQRSTQPLIAVALSPRRLHLHLTIFSNEKLGFQVWGQFRAYGKMGLIYIKPILLYFLTQVHTWPKLLIMKRHMPSCFLLPCFCSIKGCGSRDYISGEFSKEFRDEVVVLPFLKSTPAYWTPASTSCHLLSLAEPKLLSTERLKLHAFSPVSHCAIHLPETFTTASGSMWMNLRPVFGLLASHGFLPNLQTPRSFLFILLLPTRHCLGSLVDLDVRRLHLRLWLPRMFGIYIGCDRFLANAPFVTLFATSYQNSLLVPSAPTCQLLSQGRRLGSDLNSQGQTDYKLCVEFLNLYGQWLHVREDPPALLRFVTHQMRFPVSSSAKATSTWQPSNHLVSSVEHTFKSSYASIVRAKYDHLLVRDFMKLVFKLESYKTSKDLPSFASSSRLCIFLEDSCSLYLYTSCNPLLLSCKNIPLLRF